MVKTLEWCLLFSLEPVLTKILMTSHFTLPGGYSSVVHLTLLFSSIWHSGSLPPLETLACLWWHYILQAFLQIVITPAACLQGSPPLPSLKCWWFSESVLASCQSSPQTQHTLPEKALLFLPSATFPVLKTTKPPGCRNVWLRNSRSISQLNHVACHRAVSPKSTFKISESWPKQSLAILERNAFKNVYLSPDLNTFY